MNKYRVTIKPSAVKELDGTPGSFAARIESKVSALASNPRPVGVRKLKGELALWRIRVGDWRVIFSIDDENRVVDVIYIRHRSKAYE